MDRAVNEVFLIRREVPITVDESRLEVQSHSTFIATDFLLPTAFPEIVKLCDLQLERLWVAIDREKRRLFA
jgi:hypothetical protein